MILNYLGILCGLALLVFGADRFVQGAANTARCIGMPTLIIGLVVVGLGTSVPEVLVGSVAALEGKTEIAIGNAIGSNIANIGLVLGATVLIKPFVVRSATLKREYLIMLLASVIAFVILLDKELSRIDAAFLLICLIASIYWIIRLAKQTSKSDPLAGEFELELAEKHTLGSSLIVLIIGLLLLLGGAELLVHNAVVVARYFGLSDLVIGLTIIAVGTSLPELAASIMSVIKKESSRWERILQRYFAWGLSPLIISSASDVLRTGLPGSRLSRRSLSLSQIPFKTIEIPVLSAINLPLDTMAS